MTKKLTSNALIGPTKTPELGKFIDDKPVRSCRVVTKSHYEAIGSGEILDMEAVFRDKRGEQIPASATRLILDKYSNAVLNEASEEVDKKAIHTFILNPDGSRGDEAVAPPPTEVIQEVDSAEEAVEPGLAIRVPSSTMSDFLIHEQYELVAADIKNDAKVFSAAEELSKHDEVLMCTFSNGSFGTMYYAFVRPFFAEGKFELELLVSDKKVIRNLLRPIPAPSNAIKQAKPITTLPSMAKLLAPAVAKR